MVEEEPHIEVNIFMAGKNMKKYPENFSAQIQIDSWRIQLQFSRLISYMIEIFLKNCATQNMCSGDLIMRKEMEGIHCEA
jgi:hypothetical protein